MENNNLIPVHTTFENAIKYHSKSLYTVPQTLTRWQKVLSFLGIKKYPKKVKGTVQVYEKVLTITLYDHLKTDLGVEFMCTQIHSGLKELTIVNAVTERDLYYSTKLYLHSRGMPGENYLLGNI